MSKESSVPVLHPSNLPPNMRWVYLVWMLAMSIKVYDLDPGWYYALGTFTIILVIGWLSMVYRARYIDIFEVMKGPKDGK